MQPTGTSINGGRTEERDDVHDGGGDESGMGFTDYGRRHVQSLQGARSREAGYPAYDGTALVGLKRPLVIVELIVRGFQTNFAGLKLDYLTKPHATSFRRTFKLARS